MDPIINGATTTGSLFGAETAFLAPLRIIAFRPSRDTFVKSSERMLRGTGSVLTGKGGEVG